MSWGCVCVGARGRPDSFPEYVPIDGFLCSFVYWDPYSFTAFLCIIHPSHSGAASAPLSLHSSIERHVREPWWRHADYVASFSFLWFFAQCRLPPLPSSWYLCSVSCPFLTLPQSFLDNPSQTLAAFVSTPPWVSTFLSCKATGSALVYSCFGVHTNVFGPPNLVQGLHHSVCQPYSSSYVLIWRSVPCYFTSQVYKLINLLQRCSIDIHILTSIFMSTFSFPIYCTSVFSRFIFNPIFFASSEMEDIQFCRPWLNSAGDPMSSAKRKILLR